MTKEKKLNIHQRLHEVMKQVSYVQKENKKVNGQYSYVSHDAVTALVRGALVDNGIVAVPTVKKHSQDGNRTTVELQVDFVNIDNPDETVSTVSYGQGVDNQDKGIGKAYSYAYKYAMLKMFALETGEDPERDNIDHKPAEQNEDPKEVFIRNMVNAIKTAKNEQEADAIWQEKLEWTLKLSSDQQSYLLKEYEEKWGVSKTSEPLF